MFGWIERLLWPKTWAIYGYDISPTKERFVCRVKAETSEDAIAKAAQVFQGHSRLRAEQER